MIAMIQFSDTVRDRTDLAGLCNERGLLGIAVEVGVMKGSFAVPFLTVWRGRLYRAVDPYLPYIDHNYDRENEETLAHAALAPFGARVEWWKMPSAEALTKMEPSGIDFIYIDAAHDKESVAADIALSWPLLSTGGILSGHDYEFQHDGVRDAVDEFAEANDLTVYVTRDRHFENSWFCFKP